MNRCRVIALAVLALGVAMGHGEAQVRVGIGIGAPYYRPHYYHPYRVYIAPAPIYVAPVPVYAAPAAVIVQQPVMCEQPAPVYAAPAPVSRRQPRRTPSVRRGAGVLPGARARSRGLLRACPRSLSRSRRPRGNRQTEALRSKEQPEGLPSGCDCLAADAPADLHERESMRSHGRACYLLCLALLVINGSGCQTFLMQRPLAVQVRDAETKKPIAAAEVRVSYPHNRPAGRRPT